MGDKLENISTDDILQQCNIIINTLYKRYSYLNINFNDYKKLVLEEIEKTKNRYDNSKSYQKVLENSIVARIEEYIIKLLNNDDTSCILFNSYINFIYKKKKTDDYIIYYLSKIEEFFENLNYIPTPDNIIMFVSNCSLLKEIISVYNSRDLYSKKSFDNNVYHYNVVSMLIDTYNELYDKDNAKNVEDDTKSIWDEIDNCVIAGSHRQYLNEIMAIPPLTDKEEQEYLLEMTKGDEKAKEIIIEHNLKLVILIARKFYGNTMSFIDLVQEGNIGLIMAASKFDPSKECRFSTYAACWIKQMIFRSIVNYSNTIRIPAHRFWKISKYNNAVEELANEFGRMPTDKEVAEKLDMSIDAITKLRMSKRSVISLEGQICQDADEEIYEKDVLVDDDTEDSIILGNLSNEIDELFNKCNLNEREKLILALRYGLNGDDPKTLREISSMFGNISAERVRQIEMTSIKKIRMSNYIKEFAVYLDYPDKVKHNIDMYRAKYKERYTNSYKAHSLNEYVLSKSKVR